MPGTIIAMARLNRPAVMIYGGTIMPGQSQLDHRTIDIETAFQSFGAHSRWCRLCCRVWNGRWANPLLFLDWR